MNIWEIRKNKMTDMQGKEEIALIRANRGPTLKITLKISFDFCAAE
jgi:hypothetical protein